MYIYIYMYIHVCNMIQCIIIYHVILDILHYSIIRGIVHVLERTCIDTGNRSGSVLDESIEYGQFSEFHVCFCGLDPGNLKFETIRTNRQRICF